MTMKNRTKQILKRIHLCIWPLVSLALVAFFVVWPIMKLGLPRYLQFLYFATPASHYVLDEYKHYQGKRMSDEWFERVEYISEEEIPDIAFVEDTTMSGGVNSFYCLDQYSDDCRELLSREHYNLPRERGTWWLTHFTGEYLFAPECAPPALYKVEKTDSTLHIMTDDKPDNWIYLVSKKLQPTVYAIEFDFIPHTMMYETLQFDFCAMSLAQRFRFNLENNETFKFDIVDRGYFTYWANPQKWDVFKKKMSLKLHEPSHILIVVAGDRYAFYMDGECVMAVKVKEYTPQPSYWFFIFWNGRIKGNNMDIEINNFKVLYPQN